MLAEARNKPGICCCFSWPYPPRVVTSDPHADTQFFHQYCAAMALERRGLVLFEIREARAFSLSLTDAGAAFLAAGERRLPQERSALANTVLGDAAAVGASGAVAGADLAGR